MSKQEKVKVISDLVAAIAKLALNFTEGQVKKKVDNDVAEKGILLFLPPTRSVIEALNDDNPQNSDQVKEIILEWVHKDLSSYIDELGTNLSEQVENENQKAVLLFGVKVVTELLKIYSDDEKDNKEQVSIFLQSMIDDPVFRELIMSAIITPILKKAKAGDDFIMLIQKAIEYVLDTVEV